MSLTTYSSSPTSRGDGVYGACLVIVHATCERVTSPVPPTRTASNVGC